MLLVPPRQRIHAKDSQSGFLVKYLENTQELLICTYTLIILRKFKVSNRLAREQDSPERRCGRRIRRDGPERRDQEDECGELGGDLLLLLMLRTVVGHHLGSFLKQRECTALSQSHHRCIWKQRFSLVCKSFLFGETSPNERA